jgi:hypothetical protein
MRTKGKWNFKNSFHFGTILLNNYMQYYVSFTAVKMKVVYHKCAENWPKKNFLFWIYYQMSSNYFYPSLKPWLLTISFESKTGFYENKIFE